MNNNFYTKYEYAQKMLEAELNILIDSFERKHGYTPVEHVKTRLKTLPSIQKKLEKKGYSYNVENIEKGLEQDSNAIAQSAQTAKSVENGDLTARIVENPHNPQLVELKNVLNKMLDVLQKEVGSNMHEIHRVFDSYKSLDFTTEVQNAKGKEKEREKKRKRKKHYYDY